MKPEILVLYYSQSGQLRDILNSITADIQEGANFTFVQIEPETPFPLPWKANVFFDAMPETVKMEGVPVKPLPADIMNRHYDLVMFGFQPWFLHPSQPITGFLKSPSSAILKGKSVVTVTGARNMWLNATEKIKDEFLKIGAKYVGNIALVDTNPNLVSVLTVIRWSFKGQKEAGKWLPAAGVQDRDIQRARQFGPIILDHLKNNSLDTLHDDLLDHGSLELNPGLVLLEKRGVKNFKKWAKFISDKGGPGSPERLGRVVLFKRLLIVAIFILSPISNLSAFIQRQLQKKTLLKDVEYFKQLAYEPDRL